jgi:signal transduction histidine kinase
MRENQSQTITSPEEARLQISEERILAGQIALETMHEARNFVEAIGNFIYLTSKEAHAPKKVLEYMASAEQQLAALGQLTRGPLEFARPLGSRKQVDLVSLFDAALRVNQAKLDAKKIHLVRKHPEALPASVHSGEILQVISNLLINAVEALPQEGTLAIRLHKRSDHIALLVADDGPGISPENKERLFQPFFTTKSDSGTGLGLALSKKIVERHGGKIKARSRMTSGKSGTVFRILLPRE